MTASPIYDSKKPAEALNTLERNLDAKVVSVRDHVDELAAHQPRPIEVIYLKNLSNW
jgi:endoribonuclease Dicer